MNLAVLRKDLSKGKIGSVTCKIDAFGLRSLSCCSASSINAKRRQLRASLVAQWLRVCLPMQGTRVRALVWEDPTCRGATRPVSHNY